MKRCGQSVEHEDHEWFEGDAVPRLCDGGATPRLVRLARSVSWVVAPLLTAGGRRVRP